MRDLLGGLVPVAEFGSVFEADAAVALLRSCGIPALSSADPALRSPAPYMASDHSCEVLVKYYDANRAAKVLADSDEGLPDDFLVEWTPSAKGATARSAARGCLIGAMVAALAVTLVVMLVGLLT